MDGMCLWNSMISSQKLVPTNSIQEYIVKFISGHRRPTDHLYSIHPSDQSRYFDTAGRNFRPGQTKLTLVYSPRINHIEYSLFHDPILHQNLRVYTESKDLASVYTREMFEFSGGVRHHRSYERLRRFCHFCPSFVLDLETTYPPEEEGGNLRGLCYRIIVICHLFPKDERIVFLIF